jgi:hypothetical protein
MHGRARVQVPFDRWKVSRHESRRTKKKNKSQSFFKDEGRTWFCLMDEKATWELVRENDLAGLTRRLKERAALATERDPSGWTPLLRACAQGNLDMVKLLLGAGARVEERAKDLASPLHLACREGKLDVVEYLLDHGADPYALDANRETPLQVADAKQLELAVRLTNAVREKQFAITDMEAFLAVLSRDEEEAEKSIRVFLPMKKKSETWTLGILESTVVSITRENGDVYTVGGNVQGYSNSIFYWHALEGPQTRRIRVYCNVDSLKLTGEIWTKLKQDPFRVGDIGENEPWIW